MVASSFKLAALALGFSLTLASCGGSGGDGQSDAAGGDGMIAELRLPQEGAAATPGIYNYNPYATSPITTTWLFDKLGYRNTLTCEFFGSIAQDYEWTSESELKMTIKDGLTWSDGTPLTAEDVVFTFEQALKNPAMDRFGLTSSFYGEPLKSVTADGSVVTWTFAGPAPGKLGGVLDTWILPKHVYANVGPAHEYIDKEPVVSGPFQVKSYNGRSLVLERREGYWNAENIKVQNLILEGSFDANSAALKLQGGQLDVYFGDINNPEKSFVAKDPDKNGFFYAPAGATIVVLNNEKKPFDDVKFREAVAYSLDKDEMALKGTYGIMNPASQTGLKMPFRKDYLPAGVPNDGVIVRDIEKAKKILDDAGYKVGPDGFRTYPDGSKLEVTFQVQAGFVDYLAMANIVVNNLKEIGVNAKVIATDPNAVDAKKKSGDFQMVFEYINGGCDVAKDMGAKLDSSLIPDGKEILPNLARYKNPRTDQIIKDLNRAFEPEQQRALTQDLARVFYEEFPVLPVVYAPDRILYRKDKAVGWPSKDDPYAAGADKLIWISKLSGK